MSQFKVGDVVRTGPTTKAWPQVGKGTRGIVTSIDKYVNVRFDNSYPFLPQELTHEESPPDTTGPAECVEILKDIHQWIISQSGMK